MCVSDQAASSGGEENGEIDRSLLKGFLLPRTVVPAVCNMGERVLPIVRALSEAVKRERRERRSTSGKCRSVVQGGPERSLSTKGGRGPRGLPGPLRSALIHTFGNFTENVDQGGSGWTRRTRGTITPLGGPGVVFTFC